MKPQTNHIAIVLRAILLILVIATQIVVPVAGRPLVCGPECGRQETPHRCDIAGDHACDDDLCDDAGACHDDEHRSDSALADDSDQENGSGCFPYGCPCCAVLMLPGDSPLPASETPGRAIRAPALLGDPITQYLLPLDHPPC